MTKLFSAVSPNATAPAPAEHHCYDPKLFTPLYASEDQHFWFRARNQVITMLVRQIIGDLAPGYRVLEVGCGTGNVLRVLEQECTDGMVVGMDLFTQGLRYAQKRTSCALVQADMRALVFQQPFDLVGLFDVLEHIPDDAQVLRDIRCFMRPGSALLLTVPADPSLWSYFDEGAHHCRRYKLAELREKLLQTGYHIDYLSQYMMGIYPLVWMGRRIATIMGRNPAGNAKRQYDLKTNELRIVPLINDLLRGLLALEMPFIEQRYQLPFGTSLLALARKI